mmetsp:Transcript_51830/g.121690  ORF Transcript_51830/g.121690 Transcript_51830/m.121690 type:complete len:264 (+) Transcript_51830:1029-1820(+)
MPEQTVRRTSEERPVLADEPCKPCQYRTLRLACSVRIGHRVGLEKVGCGHWAHLLFILRTGIRHRQCQVRRSRRKYARMYPDHKAFVLPEDLLRRGGMVEESGSRHLDKDCVSDRFQLLLKLSHPGIINDVFEVVFVQAASCETFDLGEPRQLLLNFFWDLNGPHGRERRTESRAPLFVFVLLEHIAIQIQPWLLCIPFLDPIPRQLILHNKLQRLLRNSLRNFVTRLLKKILLPPLSLNVQLLAFQRVREEVGVVLGIESLL